MSLHHSGSSTPAVPLIPTNSSGINPRTPGQQQMGNRNAALGHSVQHDQHQSKGSSSTAPKKPVFKMKRTGFSGPVPLASPSAPPPPGAGDGTSKANPSPLAATHTETASGPRSGANPVSLKEGQNMVLMQTVSLKEARRHSDASKENVSRQSPHLQNFPTADGLDRHHPIELMESDPEMVDTATSGTHTPAPVQIFTPSATQPKDNAFDDKSYRVWTGAFQHPPLDPHGL